MHDDTARRDWLAYAGLTLTALFWAGNAVVARGVVGEIPPLALSFWRWAIALIVLLPFGLPRLLRERATLRQRWPFMVVLAALSVGLFNTLLYLAALTTTAVNITLINATMPVAVPLLALLVLRERLTRRRAAGIAIALTGMLVVVSRGSLATFLALSFQTGDLLMVAAIFSWSLFSVLMRRFAVPMEPLAFLTAQVALGIPVILPFYLLELALGHTFTLTPTLVWPFLYVALLPGLAAYLFWNHGVTRVGPSNASMFIYLTPLFAAGLAGAFLGERLHGFHAVGGLLILVGLYLSTRTRSPGRTTVPADRPLR